MGDTKNDLGPRKVSLMVLGFRALAGVAGGITGTMVLLFSVFLGASFFSTEQGADETSLNPLIIFVFMAVTFLSSCLSNSVSTFLIGLTDRSKYKNLFSSMYQIFAVNLAIMILMAPIYIIVSGLDITFMAYVAAIQILLSVIASALILEILSDAKYALLGVYNVVLGLIFASAFNFVLYQMAGQNPTILLFAALPIIWMMLGLFNGLVGMGYRFIYDAYGIDFLSKYVKYGRDEEEPEGEADITEKEILGMKKDYSGSDFLKK